MSLLTNIRAYIVKTKVGLCVIVLIIAVCHPDHNLQPYSQSFRLLVGNGKSTDSAKNGIHGCFRGS